jgi:hypothetical protein
MTCGATSPSGRKGCEKSGNRGGKGSKDVGANVIVLKSRERGDPTPEASRGCPHGLAGADAERQRARRWGSSAESCTAHAASSFAPGACAPTARGQRQASPRRTAVQGLACHARLLRRQRAPRSRARPALLRQGPPGYPSLLPDSLTGSFSNLPLICLIPSSGRLSRGTALPASVSVSAALPSATPPASAPHHSPETTRNHTHGRSDSACNTLTP